MGILEMINDWRRIIMRRLAKGIGNHNHLSLNTSPSNTIKRILISRPNDRLGNLLLITPLLQEVITTFPACKIDLFVKGNLAPILFKNYDHVETIIQLPRKPFKELLNYIKAWLLVRKNKYDLVINVVNYSSSGRLSTQLSNSTHKLFGDDHELSNQKYPDAEHIAKYPVYSLRFYLNKLKSKPIPSLNLKLSSIEFENGQMLLNNLVKNKKRTISLFTYATGAKKYSVSYWTTFYRNLKREFGNYNIIEVLPKENVSQIDFQAPTFYSNDIREIGALIANTDVFIGADSGIMHLASSVNTPTVGLFSVTDSKVYAPYNENSLAINTNHNTLQDTIKALRKILKTKKAAILNGFSYFFDSELFDFFHFTMECLPV
ncbi:glycosyltransferase family 9 protein [Flavobacterium sp. '19STA2R22 D10 B1']|uniref:glycosyltransferase family 9 protein n=1 Tax=Flavobacterium aerium TaxID=3037261 RepID=UPI00278C4A82|nr:glycosyltransferase family 9 protein [Flavobacterium sp. '19STA2R22 D10 B1']